MAYPLLSNWGGVTFAPKTGKPTGKPIKQNISAKSISMNATEIVMLYF